MIQTSQEQFQSRDAKETAASIYMSFHSFHPCSAVTHTDKLLTTRSTTAARASVFVALSSLRVDSAGIHFISAFNQSALEKSANQQVFLIVQKLTPKNRVFSSKKARNPLFDFSVCMYLIEAKLIDRVIESCLF